MILGVDELLRRVKEEKLVENLSERELMNPEGAGFDFRIGEIFAIEGAGFLGVTERETPQMKPLGQFQEGMLQTVQLEPRVYYVGKTVEVVNTSQDLLILFRPRSTLFRSGVTAFTGTCSPGYRGALHFGLMNFRDVPFRIELGARIVNAIFFQVSGLTNLYRGQWQGGRTTTAERERQV